jgi:uncharacterized protein YjiS (DUF1127 family)
MWKHLRDWWRAWGDLIHLERLDDRLLADMGVEREALQARVIGREPPLAANAIAPCACRPASAPVQG